MALLKALLPLHLRLLGREWTAGAIRSVNALTACVLTGYLWRRFVVRAARLTAGGVASPGIAPALLLSGAFLTWCAVLPLLGVTPAQSGGLAPQRMRTQPVPARVFLQLATIQLVLHPAFWLGAGMQWGAASPFLRGASSLFAAPAFVLYVLLVMTSTWAGVLFASAGALRFFRRRVIASIPAATLLVIATAMAAGLRLRHDGAGDVLWFHGRSLPLLNTAHDAGLVADAVRLLPPSWLLDASRGHHAWRACGLLALAVVAAGAAVQQLYRALATNNDVPARTGRRVWPRLPMPAVVPGVAPPLGAAWAREWRVLTRANDVRAGFIVSLAGVFLLVVLREVYPTFAVVWAQFVVLANAGCAFNIFGLDARAVDRFRLLPLTSTHLLMAKGLALASCVAAQLVPLWMAAGFRFGPVPAAATVLASLVSALGFAVGGPAISLYFGTARIAGTEGSPNDAGGMPGVVSAIVILGVAAACGLLALHAPGPGFTAGALVLAGLAMACRWAWAGLGRRFDARFEILRERLRG